MADRYTIDEDFEPLVRELIASGRFANPKQVVRAGLRLLEEQEAERKRREAEMWAKIEEGIRAGEAGDVIPAEDVFAEVREMLASRQRRDAAE